MWEIDKVSDWLINVFYDGSCQGTIRMSRTGRKWKGKPLAQFFPNPRGGVGKKQVLKVMKDVISRIELPKRPFLG